MATNRLVMLMSTIPDSVIELNARFNDGIFNTDGTKRQIDGYAVDENEKIILPKSLCHAENYLRYLCRGEENPAQAVQTILDSSYELRVSDYRKMLLDENSEWFKKHGEPTL